jgi:predicted aldo/keto reductase-like oxidoreductase
MNRQTTVRLGKSNLSVTRIGFGGIPIQRLTEKQTVQLLRYALEAGINWIDTATGYGTSEERIGKALQGRSREAVLLFTKGPAHEPAAIRQQIELSLQRLQSPYLDLYQFHIVPSPEVWQAMQENGTIETVLEYQRRGVIRHVGASAHTREAALAVIEHPAVEVLQYPFNFIVEEEGCEILEACRRRQVGFIAMKPFAGGALENAAACIRFLLQYPDLVTDPGFQRPEEIDEVLALAREKAPLDAQDRALIARLRAELGQRFCRRCGYCSPCPSKVDIISLMTMDSIIKRFPPSRLAEGWIGAAGRSAELCTECGECEDKCPYKLPIMTEIRRGAEAWRAAVPGGGV